MLVPNVKNVFISQSTYMYEGIQNGPFLANFTVNTGDLMLAELHIEELVNRWYMSYHAQIIIVELVACVIELNSTRCCVCYLFNTKKYFTDTLLGKDQHPIQLRVF